MWCMYKHAYIIPSYIYLYISYCRSKLNSKQREVVMKPYTIYYLMNGDLCSITIEANDSSAAKMLAVFILNRLSLKFDAIYLPDWH